MKPIVIAEDATKKYSRNANSHLAYGISDLFAEMGSEEKNRISHRADALAKLKSAVAALGEAISDLFS